MRLGHHGSQRADQEARLIFVVDDPDQIRKRPVRVLVVFQQELIGAHEEDLGIFLGSRIRRFGQVEAARHDHVVAGIRERGNVRVVALGVRRLNVLDPVRVAIGLGLLQAFPG